MITRQITTGNREKQKTSQDQCLNTDSNPRDQMRLLFPEWSQRFLTELTAKPYSGESQKHKNVLIDTINTFCVLFGGLILSINGLRTHSIFLLFLGWLVTLHSLRKLRLTIMHACAHDSVFKSKLSNYILGELISLLTLSSSFEEYKRNHLRTHHSKNLMQEHDETYDYLIKSAGFKKGMSKQKAWKHLWKTLFSPKFHIQQILKRLKLNLCSKNYLHNFTVGSFWIVVLVLVLSNHAGIAFLSIWLLPSTILFEISSLLRQCVEHRFVKPTGTPHYKESWNMTAAIFCGEAPPITNLKELSHRNAIGFVIWLLRFSFYHFPVRLLILTGDSPCHDYHHRNPNSKEWINCIYQRQEALENGQKYYETWGFLNAVDQTFASLQF